MTNSTRNKCTVNYLSGTRRSGFTLIELLVVIAIIAILAAILFPVFSKARENARKASCLSNLKQLGLGFSQYLQDYDSRYPGAGQYQKWGNGAHWIKGRNSDNNGNPGALASVTVSPFNPTGEKADIEGGAIFSYIKNAQVYLCPSNMDGETKRMSYAMNCAIAGIPEAVIFEASSIILLVDEEKANDGYLYAWSGNTSTDAITKLHNSGGNLLFVDGHAKFFPTNAFPLENNQVNTSSGTLKTRTTGSPRFYDPSFGAGGYYNGGIPFGTCENPNTT